jgi:predicted dehydrogenase
MINIGVIGYGYWGPNLVRNFNLATKTRVVAVSDLDENRLGQVAKNYPTIQTTTDFRKILSNRDIDAVVVATPVSTHFSLSMSALAADKHVLVEKPMASSLAESLQLVEEAKQRNLILMVDHTFLFTGAVQKIRELVDSGELGEHLYYYDSVRVNLGLFQSDVNVMWDLAVHDLSILRFLIDSEPISISATGMSHIPGAQKNVAYLTLFYDNDFIAHINVNWMAPLKIRQTLLGGGTKMVVYNDLEPSEKIKIYDKGVQLGINPHEAMVGYRSGDMYAPHIAPTEALIGMVNHFAECVETGNSPVTDGRFGASIVGILEAADLSISRNGEPVALKQIA